MLCELKFDSLGGIFGILGGNVGGESDSIGCA